MNGFEDRALITNISRWRKTQSTNKASAHIRENVSIKIWHDQDFVVVWYWVSDYLQAGVVKKLGIKLHVWEVLGDPTCGSKEETVTHFHDCSLVNCSDLRSVDIFGILEGKPKHTLTGVSCNELDALYDAIHDHMLDSGVFTLGIFSYQNSVDVIIGGFITCDRAARSNIGK